MLGGLILVFNMESPTEQHIDFNKSLPSQGTLARKGSTPIDTREQLFISILWYAF